MATDPFKDPETPADERRKRREAERARQDKADFEHVMSSVQGRRFVWRLLNAAGTFGPSIGPDAHTTVFNEGRRATGIALMQECQRVVPARYLEMVHERVADEAKEALEEKTDGR